MFQALVVSSRIISRLRSRMLRSIAGTTSRKIVAAKSATVSNVGRSTWKMKRLRMDHPGRAGKGPSARTRREPARAGPRRRVQAAAFVFSPGRCVSSDTITSTAKPSGIVTIAG